MGRYHCIGVTLDVLTEVATKNIWNSEQNLLWHRSASNGACIDAPAAFVRKNEWEYEDITKALKERFVPTSRRNCYKAKFQTL